MYVCIDILPNPKLLRDNKISLIGQTGICSNNNISETVAGKRQMKKKGEVRDKSPVPSSSSSGEEIVTEKSKRSWKENLHNNWVHFWENPSDYYMYYVYTLLIFMVISLSPRQSTGSKIVKIFDGIDSFCNWLGLPISGINQTEWRTLFIEAYVALVCRSFTDLFVRRLLNPENVYDHDGTLKKFAIDSCFGGAGAASFVFLRKMLLSNLK